MKVEASPFLALYPKVSKKEPQQELFVETNPKDANQVLKEIVQRRISEMEEAQTNMGEDDPRAQILINKFKDGKKLTPKEMNYVRKNAPGMVDYIDRIQKERVLIELAMKSAPTKTHVQMVAYRTSKQIEKHQNPEEREIRAKHLADAKREYEKTDEYNEKQNSPLDKVEKKLSIKFKQRSTYEVAIETYKKQL